MSLVHPFRIPFIAHRGVLAALLVTTAILGCGESEEPEATPGQPELSSEAEALLQQFADRLEGITQGQIPSLPKYKPKYSPEIEDLLIEIRFLDDQDPATLVRLERELAHEHEAVREEVVSKLEDIGNDRAAAMLGDVLDNDKSEEVRLRAVEGLDYVVMRNLAAADQMLRGLSDESKAVREACADNLGFLALPQHEEAIRKAWKKERDLEVLQDLADALQNIQITKEQEAAKARPPKSI